MQALKVASLNINGGRSAQKRALISEIVKRKKIDVVFLQETHSDVLTEADWSLWWRGQLFFSHGSSHSAGVAVCFSPSLDVRILSSIVIENGRALMVKAEINNFIFSFINVYAQNLGPERLSLFKKNKAGLSQL